jgi:hypothetical protein
MKSDIKAIPLNTCTLLTEKYNNSSPKTQYNNHPKDYRESMKPQQTPLNMIS